MVVNCAGQSLMFSFRENKESKLLGASESGDVDKVTRLLRQNSYPWHCRRRALELASKNGHAAVADLLLGSGIDFDDDTGCMEAIFVAAWNGHLEIVQLMVKYGIALDYPDSPNNPLHQAASNNNSACTELLLKAGAAPDLRDGRGETILHKAAYFGSAEVVEILVKGGASMNLKDEFGDTPLHNAATFNNVAVVHALACAGADIDVKTQNGDTPLHKAAGSNYVAVIDVLVRAGADIEMKDRYGRTPLHEAARCGQIAVAESLLQAGASVNMRDFNKQTPVFQALEYGNVAVFELLVKAGALVDLKDQEGNTPLHIAASEGKIDFVHALLEAGAALNLKDSLGNTPLHQAVCNQHEAVVAMLLEAGAPLEIQDKHGKTPVHIAASCGNVTQVELFLNAGASVDMKNEERQTPLHQAARNGHDQVIQVLVQAGAEIEATDSDGQVPLHKAVLSGNEVVVDLLLKAGASINIQDHNDQTPLHHAVREKHQAVIELLVKSGAAVDLKDRSGQTPLQAAQKLNYASAKLVALLKEERRLIKASQDGLIDEVKRLLQKGVNVNYKDENGQTALHKAAECGQNNVIELLIKAGALIDVKDNTGQTPMDIIQASQCANADSIDLFSRKKQEERQLLKSSEDGDINGVLLLLRNGTNPDFQDIHGRTPLHKAAWRGHIRVIELLVKAGANVNLNDEYGHTPLQVARNSLRGSGLRDIHFLPELEKHKLMQLLSRQTQNEMGLFQASAAGDVDAVKRMLGCGIDVNCQDIFDQSGLYLAASSGHESVVQVLMKAGAALDSKEYHGWTPLHAAAKNGHIAAFELLLKAGASLDSKDHDGNSPVNLAQSFGHANITNLVEVYSLKKEEEKQILTAAHLGDIDTLTRLLENGVDVNHQDEFDQSVLHAAAENGHFAMVKLLLKFGAIVDSKDKDRRTPLLKAAAKGHLQVVDMLLKANAFIDANDIDGWTSLHAAAKNGHEAVVELLLDSDASIDMRDIDGQTPLELAQEYEFTNIIKLIEDKWISTCSQNTSDLDKAITADQSYKAHDIHDDAVCIPLTTENSVSSNQLQYNLTEEDREKIEKAIEDACTEEVIKYLELGVSPNVVNEKGNTLLHLAVQVNRESIVELLLRSPGINATTTNQENDTPLILAVKLGHRRLASIIYGFIKPSIATLNVPDTAIIVDLNHSLGAGGYGCVYKGTYNDEDVAVKTSHNGMEDLLIQEIAIMAKCRSPYIVDIVAVSGQSTSKPKLALQFMDCGDLRQYLDAKRIGKPTTINVTPLEVGWVVANALADLHHNSTLHRDLKSQNVLLSTKHHIKLGDLGISREFTQSTMTQTGTPLWEAPEVLRGERYSYAADIYSFGVILTELDTLQLPYFDTQLNTWAIVDRVKQGILRPTMTDSCEPWLKTLAWMCLAHDPDQRPSSQDVVDMLGVLRHNPGNAKWVERKAEFHYSSTIPAATPLRKSESTAPKTLSKWTQIPCQNCTAMNHIAAKECWDCQSPMRSPAEMVKILLKRNIVAQSKGIHIEWTMDCPSCWCENDLQAANCKECQFVLSDDGKLAVLLKGFESLSTSAA